MPNELEKFFEDLPTEDKREQDIFNVKEVQEEKAPEKVAEDEESSFKNRRERRLAEKLEKEREMGIALNERVKLLSEQVNNLTTQRNTNESPSEIDPRLARAFGTTEEGKEITKIFQDVLADTANQAANRAREATLAEIEERQKALTEAQSKEESYIDQELAAIEEEHNVDLTSNSPAAKKARNEFLGLVERLSPKDSSGGVKEYADFGTAFEVYKSRQVKAEPSRAKELAARSMQASTGNGSQPAPEGRMTFKRATQEINRLFNN